MSEFSKFKIKDTIYDVKDATAREQLALKLSDAPSNGEEYVRKNGQWAISSGGSGGGGSTGVSAMYFSEQTVNTATNAEILRITDPRIHSDSIILECTFANPSYISGNVTWTSYNGYITLTGTCTTATTANVTIGYASNDNFSDRLMTLLWENSSPTSNFTAQTINLDLSNYDLILFNVKQDTTYSNGNEYAIDQNIGFVGENVTLHVINHIVPSGLSGQNSYISTRNANITTTGITFGAGYGKKISDSSVGTQDNKYCIPLKIYGISRYNYFEEKEPERVSLANGYIIMNRYGKLRIVQSYGCSASYYNNLTLEVGDRPKDNQIATGFIADSGSNARIAYVALNTDGTFNCYYFNSYNSGAQGNVSSSSIYGIKFVYFVE